MNLRFRVLYAVLLAVMSITACVSCASNKTEVVKPRYHRTWYKKHVYKKKWHVGRIWIRPERQGVKKVRVRN